MSACKTNQNRRENVAKTLKAAVRGLEKEMRKKDSKRKPQASMVSHGEMKVSPNPSK